MFSSFNSSQINETDVNIFFDMVLSDEWGVTLTWVLRKFDITANEE